MESRRGRPVRRLKNRPLIFYAPGLRPTFPSKPAKRLAGIFHAKPRPEALPALRRLLDHPSLTVAREAAAALESAGEKADIPPKLGPVRYRIEVDGNPYAARRVEWIVSWGATSMWTSSERQRMRRGWPTCRATCSSTNPQGQSNRSPCAARPGSDSRTRCSACSYLLLPIPMMGVFD